MLIYTNAITMFCRVFQSDLAPVLTVAAAAVFHLPRQGQRARVIVAVFCGLKGFCSCSNGSSSFLFSVFWVVYNNADWAKLSV